MKIMTWGRKSHALFDYENRTPKKLSLKTNMTGILTRNEDDHVVGFTEEYTEDPKVLALAELRK